MSKKLFFAAMFTLVGTIIGAGVLGIPYVVAKSGILIGLLNVGILGAIIMFMHLYLGEIVLRTKGNHQLTGYAEIYLGKIGKDFMLVAMLIGIYGALLAYIIGEGEALKAIFGGSSLVYSIAFFVVASFIVFKGIKTLAKSEFWINILMLLAILIIIVFAFGNVDISNLTHFNIKNVFIPYGVVLFAFIGTAAVPELKEELSHNRELMKKAIVWGTLIPIILYAIFAIVVTGVVGLKGFSTLGVDERVATVALGQFVGPSMIIFGNLFAIFAMMTSFIALGFALKSVYQYDYKIKKIYAWALTCLIPFGVYLLDYFWIDLTNFISTLSITGTFAGGIDGILIVLMFWAAKKKGVRKPEYSLSKMKFIGWLIIVVFVIGMLYATLSMFNLVPS